MAKYRTLKGDELGKYKRAKVTTVSKKPAMKMTIAPLIVGPSGKTTRGKPKDVKVTPITEKEFNAPPRALKKKKRKYGVRGGKIGPPKPKK